MLKRIISKTKKLENEKSILTNKQAEIQTKIESVDNNLKKLNTLKKEYEKLEEKTINIFSSLSNGDAK